MLPKECYLTTSGGEQVAQEGNERWVLDRLSIDKDGIFIYIKGAQYPYKNFCTAEAVFIFNQVKALFVETLKICAKWYFVPITPFLYWNRNKIIEGFNRVAWKISSPALLKFQYLSTFSRAFHYTIFSFLVGMGIKENEADRFATVFVHLIDFDNAYRLRLTDIFSETSEEKLRKQPIREILKLAKLKRDTNPIVVNNFKKLAYLIIILLFIPRVRKSFKNCLGEFDKMWYDEGDRYWVCMRKDYDFMGMTYEERQTYAKNKGWTFPTSEKI